MFDFFMEFLAVLLIEGFNDLLLDVLVTVEEQGLHIKAKLAQDIVNVLFICQWSSFSCICQDLGKELLLLVLSFEDLFFELGLLHFVIVDET